MFGDGRGRCCRERVVAVGAVGVEVVMACAGELAASGIAGGLEEGEAGLRTGEELVDGPLRDDDPPGVQSDGVQLALVDHVAHGSRRDLGAARRLRRPCRRGAPGRPDDGARAGGRASGARNDVGPRDLLSHGWGRRADRPRSRSRICSRSRSRLRSRPELSRMTGARDGAGRRSTKVSTCGHAGR